jgi:16S rRNA G966 N2-methylase RsmD
MSSVPLHGEWSSCRGIVDTTMRILVQFDVHGNESLKNFAGLGSQTLEARVRDVRSVYRFYIDQTVAMN